MIDIICDELGIRPLAGIMVLICGRSGHRLHRYRRRIRPLAGIMVLIGKLLFLNIRKPYIRIRPLAGIMVLIFKSPKGGNITFVDMNPSPCGDYGSYPVPQMNEQFHPSGKNPSPCGDYGSYRQPGRRLSVGIMDESVPLRGLWFLSCSRSLTIPYRPIRIRPLAGIMVLIVRKEEKNMATYEDESVPLRGLWFLSHTILFAVVVDDVCESVPLRGLWFLSAGLKS